MEKSDLKLETLLVNEEREVRGVFSPSLKRNIGPFCEVTQSRDVKTFKMRT